MALWEQREHARRILSREVGQVRKPRANRIRVALAFPNTYHVGMSNLGFQGVYRLFNDLDEIACERVFLPPKQQIRHLLSGRTPLLTIESQSRVSEFDVLAFSVSFEWDYVNVLTILRLSGLPVYAAERTERHPLVVIGGAVTFLNPEPLAPFADVVAVGEGEVLVPSLARAIGEAEGRSDLLERLAAEPGFYVPSFVDAEWAADGTQSGFVPRGAGTGARSIPIGKATFPATLEVAPPSTTIFTPDTEFGSRLLIEVVRGCANLCRFCWAGYNYLPVRPFTAAAIIARAEAARAHAGRIGLVSIALCDHPDIDQILDALLRLDYSISPASLRLDDLTESMVRALCRSGERTLTIAPETGSDRLRRVLNKSFTNEQVLDRAELIFASGIENLKLYFMIGLPTECDEDLVAIRDLVLRIRERMHNHARRRGRIGRIIGSVNTLIPKPGTAYQWLPMEDPKVTGRKIRKLRALVAGLDNVYFNIKSERLSHYQALLSLGDRRVARVIEAAERSGGNWRAATEEAGIDIGFYVFRDRSADAVLPWDIVGTGANRSFLRSEFTKGLRAETTEPLRSRWPIVPRDPQTPAG
jgi:radical SAM superfamily enzyme YgiQ (UPF0313 family)